MRKILIVAEREFRAIVGTKAFVLVRCLDAGHDVRQFHRHGGH